MHQLMSCRPTVQQKQMQVLKLHSRLVDFNIRFSNWYYCIKFVSNCIKLTTNANMSNLISHKGVLAPQTNFVTVCVFFSNITT